MPATKTLNKPANATGSAMKKKVDVKKWVLRGGLSCFWYWLY